MRRRVIHIDSLAVSGGVIPASGGAALARAVEVNLAQLLAAPHGRGEMRGADVVRMNARSAVNASPDAIARIVAHSVYTAMKGKV